MLLGLACFSGHGPIFVRKSTGPYRIPTPHLAKEYGMQGQEGDFSGKRAINKVRPHPSPMSGTIIAIFSRGC
jgi:hypothetical protein